MAAVSLREHAGRVQPMWHTGWTASGCITWRGKVGRLGVWVQKGRAQRQHGQVAVHTRVGRAKHRRRQARNPIKQDGQLRPRHRQCGPGHPSPHRALTNAQLEVACVPKPTPQPTKPIRTWSCKPSSCARRKALGLRCIVSRRTRHAIACMANSARYTSAGGLGIGVGPTHRQRGLQSQVRDAYSQAHARTPVGRCASRPHKSDASGAASVRRKRAGHCNSAMIARSMSRLPALTCAACARRRFVVAGARRASPPRPLPNTASRRRPAG